MPNVRIEVVIGVADGRTAPRENGSCTSLRDRRGGMMIAVGLSGCLFRRLLIWEKFRIDSWRLGRR
jgi:hypothetical protein